MLLFLPYAEVNIYISGQGFRIHVFRVHVLPIISKKKITYLSFILVMCSFQMY